jgi:predicted ATPase
MAITSSLPQTELTPRLGRSAEVDAIDELLRLGGTRLVILIGPGGVGKTRLALAAGDKMAGAFPDGVVFVDLAVV